MTGFCGTVCTEIVEEITGDVAGVFDNENTGDEGSLRGTSVAGDLLAGE